MKPKHPIWKHYSVVEEGDKIKTAICKVCDAVVSAKAERLRGHRLKCLGLVNSQKLLESKLSDLISTETDRKVLAHLETLSKSLNSPKTQGNSTENPHPDSDISLSDIVSDITLLQQSYAKERTSSNQSPHKEKTTNGASAGPGAGNENTTGDGLGIKREPISDDDGEEEGQRRKRVRYIIHGPSTSEQDNSTPTEMSSSTSDTSNAVSQGAQSRQSAESQGAQFRQTAENAGTQSRETAESQGAQSRESADNSILPCISGATNKRKITQDDLNQMQYEVLVEQKKKLIAQTKYYNLMNEDVVKKNEKLTAKLAYYKNMHEKLWRDLHGSAPDTDNEEAQTSYT